MSSACAWAEVLRRRSALRGEQPALARSALARSTTCWTYEAAVPVGALSLCGGVDLRGAGPPPARPVVVVVPVPVPVCAGADEAALRVGFGLAEAVFAGAPERIGEGEADGVAAAVAAPVPRGCPAGGATSVRTVSVWSSECGHSSAPTTAATATVPATAVPTVCRDRCRCARRRPPRPSLAAGRTWGWSSWCCMVLRSLSGAAG